MSLLKNTYDRFEQIKGRKLAYLISGVFILFLLAGLGVGYITSLSLKNDEKYLNKQDVIVQTGLEEVSYEGKVRFVDPKLYPDDNISYVLVDTSGNETILLRANDQILAVAENSYGTVFGIVGKTQKGEDVLIVDRISISNVSN